LKLPARSRGNVRDSRLSDCGRWCGCDPMQTSPGTD
jgi:hypothetical protein